MSKFLVLLISLQVVNHSAKENEDATFGLFFPLIILAFWLYFGNPAKTWKEESSNEYRTLNKFRYFAAFFLLIFMTIVGVYNGIRYFFFTD